MCVSFSRNYLLISFYYLVGFNAYSKKSSSSNWKERKKEQYVFNIGFTKRLSPSHLLILKDFENLRWNKDRTAELQQFQGSLINLENTEY